MNLYIHIEVSAREEDSTLLKAVLAAHSLAPIVFQVFIIFYLNGNLSKVSSYKLEYNNWKKNF